ncbi:MAG TPA: hypothetical protein VFI70_13155 [Nitrososphaeraceae archaeon]|nr:hypothetical protein [Nitrososphaeraceae archaeon]
MVIITLEVIGSLVIRYIHFFSSIMWWGIMFFMFIIIFPANKDSRYSTLFPRVQRFMKVVASIALASGIILTLMNTKFTIERLFSTSLGYTILTGATISIFVYIHILMQNRRGSKTTTTTATAASLQGKSRDQISKEVGIGAGTVSSIINECTQNDSEFDLMRQVAVKMKMKAIL